MTKTVRINETAATAIKVVEADIRSPANQVSRTAVASWLIDLGFEQYCSATQAHLDPFSMSAPELAIALRNIERRRAPEKN